MNMEFFKGKSVFVTGHTGFKGAWLCHVLKKAGAFVTGFALAPEKGSMFTETAGNNGIVSVIGDIRDFTLLSTSFEAAKPEVIFHLAAQPLVLDSYERPIYTFETNIMGSVNLLECVRRSESARSVVVITTDKVYRNNEWRYGYREIDALGGNDPYSASKSCVELVTESYSSSFLSSSSIPASTARAGNVIGGGDISKNRIIPDCVRAAVAGETIIVRNPASVRPYQHVLDSIFAYLRIAQKQYAYPASAGSYNIGPAESDCVTTGELVTIFCKHWGNNQAWESVSLNNVQHESGFLRLDCAKMRLDLDWSPVWNVKEAVKKTIEWEKARYSGGDVCAITNRQIEEYLEETNK